MINRADPLQAVVKLGTCEAGLCTGQAVAEISLDTLSFNPETLQARAITKQVKICMKHKSSYFKYQDELMDSINPERKKHGRQPEQRISPNMGYSPGFAKRFRSFS